MAASAFAKLIFPSAWESRVISKVRDIVTILAWAYNMPMSTFHSLSDGLRKCVAAVYESAHELSIILKRDILSVRMSVVLGPHPGSSFDSSGAHRVWPEMEGRDVDNVIGYFALGLTRTTPGGDMSYLTMPTVTTESLIREVGGDMTS